MGPLSDWRGHVPALIALSALIFTAKLVSLANSGLTHPYFLPAWLGLDLLLVGWAVWDERRKREGR